jgi:hypothetical protein
MYNDSIKNQPYIMLFMFYFLIGVTLNLYSKNGLWTVVFTSEKDIARHVTLYRYDLKSCYMKMQTNVELYCGFGTIVCLTSLLSHKKDIQVVKDMHK